MRSLFARSLLAALAGAVLVASVARADDGHGDDDQDEARSALERGEVLPLADILDRVQQQLPGRILEVELEQEHGAWIYEFKVLRQDGQRVEIYVNATTAAILPDEGD